MVASSSALPRLLWLTPLLEQGMAVVHQTSSDVSNAGGCLDLVPAAPTQILEMQSVWLGVGSPRRVTYSDDTWDTALWTSLA